MRHRVAKGKLGRPTAHRMSMLKTAVTDLIRNERLITTHAKAKSIRPLVKKVITRGKKGTLDQRRRTSAFLSDKSMVAKVFDELASRYAERQGGYVRILKVGTRKGDGSEMSLIELIR